MENEPMTKLIDALSARTRFGEIMERAEKQNLRFLVSRRGRPKVVILGVEDYLRNIIKKPSIIAEIQEDAKKAGLDKMGHEEINAEIKNFRRSRK
jgi:prevent-host-death family protein